MPSSPPPLTVEARNQANSARDRFHVNLIAIAERLARENSAEKVLRPHVNEALLALKRSGLERQGKRYKSCLTFGSLLVGLSLSVASFSHTLLQDNSGQIAMKTVGFWTFVVITPVLMSSIGIGLLIFGWAKTH